MNTQQEKPRAFSYTEDQSRAVDSIRRWHQQGQGPFSMGGLAGTGKTTVLARLPEELGVSIDVLAPTGKAAQVLKSKGIEAETIHSYIYNFQGKSRFDDSRTGESRQVLHFERKDGRSGEASLIAVDESSMISQDVYDDLMTIGDARILFVGDHGQLEPVGRNPGVMKNPHVRLESIMRQALDNPIVAFAHRVRQKAQLRENLDLADGSRLRIVGRADSDRIAKYAMDSGVDQIIVPFHRKRHAINRSVRWLMGFKNELNKGDRVVARMNNRRQQIFNGNQFEIVSDPRKDDSYFSEIGDRRFIASLRSIDSGQVWEDMALFLPSDAGDWNDNCHKLTNIAIDYAYAITCHVAQGSEWDNVLVVYAPCRAWSDERWLYTAATRAANKLTVMVG